MELGRVQNYLMMLLVSTLIVLIALNDKFYVYGNASELDSPRFIEQRPLGLSTNRTPTLKNGERCQFSADCLSGCCLRKGSRRSKCQPKAQRGDKCSIGQIKLDLYVDHCPCEAGLSACDHTKDRCQR